MLQQMLFSHTFWAKWLSKSENLALSGSGRFRGAVKPPHNGSTELNHDARGKCTLHPTDKPNCRCPRTVYRPQSRVLTGNRLGATKNDDAAFTLAHSVDIVIMVYNGASTGTPSAQSRDVEQYRMHSCNPRNLLGKSPPTSATMVEQGASEVQRQQIRTSAGRPPEKWSTPRCDVYLRCNKQLLRRHGCRVELEESLPEFD